MQVTTPISESKSAALSRVLDGTTKGYTHYVCGTLPALKLAAFLVKFHERYAIAASPAQRLTRQRHARANAMLTVFLPVGHDVAEWLMQVTPGAGFEDEILRDLTSKSRLNWLGYELIRYANKRRTSWTWRRPKAEMEDHYAVLRRSISLHRMDEVQALLARLSNQPGFHGVREQSKALFHEARKMGFKAEMPYLYFMSKISHGRRVPIS
jgi:hypothetical protein